ncbi:MAG: SH3 domain-containing protein [Flavobacterium sp.]
MNKIILLFICFSIYSCTTPEKRVKKIISRLNEGEITSASKYIYPKDHAKLYVFNKRFIENDNSFYIELLETKALSSSNDSDLIIKYKISSSNSYLNSYFEKQKKLVDGVVIDTVFEREFKGDKYSSFDFGFENPSLENCNLMLANINSKKINLRKGPSENYSVIKQINQNDEIIIDGDFENNKWRKGIYFDNNSNLNIAYFSSKLSSVSDISFFSLGWIDNLGILFLSLLAIVVAIIIYPLLVVSLFRTGANGAGTFAIILLIILIITVYFTYQIIENAIFELLLINLPY